MVKESPAHRQSSSITSSSLVEEDVSVQAATMSDSHSKPFNVKFEMMSESLGSQFRKDFPPYIDGLVRSSPGNYVTTPVYAESAEDFYNLKPRKDDVYVLTFPKSGA